MDRVSSKFSVGTYNRKRIAIGIKNGKKMGYVHKKVFKDLSTSMMGIYRLPYWAKKICFSHIYKTFDADGRMMATWLFVPDLNSAKWTMKVVYIAP